MVDLTQDDSVSPYVLMDIRSPMCVITVQVICGSAFALVVNGQIWGDGRQQLDYRWLTCMQRTSRRRMSSRTQMI